MFIVEIYHRPDGGDTRIGPFSSRSDAFTWAEKQGLETAVWNIRKLVKPRDTIVQNYESAQ